MTDRVRTAVERWLHDSLGPAASIVGWDGPHQRDWSWQYSIRVGGPEGGDMLVKVPRWDEAPTLQEALDAGEQDSTHREIDGLRRIELAVLSSGDPGLTAVEPIGYVGDINAILMRRLPGESLRERLGRGSGHGDMGGIFDRVGRWIRVFHAIDGAPESRPFDGEAAIERSRTLEHELRSSGRAPGRLLSAMAMLRIGAGELDGVTERWAEIHGDLNLSNVLVAVDDRVAVIDPNREIGPALLDPVRVVTDVGLEKSQLLTGGVVRRRSVVAGWEQRLLTASGLDAEPTLGFRLAEAAVERWARLEIDLDGPARMGLATGRRLLSRTVRRRLDAVL